MRLLGLALLSAWLIAWACAPRGEPLRPTSIAGGVAIRGGDVVGVAWLELRHGGGASPGTVCVAIIRGDDIGSVVQFPVDRSAVSFQLRDVGSGGAHRFELDTEHRYAGRRERTVQRIDEASGTAPVIARRVVDDAAAMAGAPGVADRRVVPRFDEGVRYRLWGERGAQGIATLATRFVGGESQVALERLDDEGRPRRTIILAPEARFAPDHRPVLRRLAALPLLSLLLGGLGPMLRLRRLRSAPLDARQPLAPGRVTLEGVLARHGDDPQQGLRLRRGAETILVRLDGAQLLRASLVRRRDEPRGDVVDVASGAPCVATGTLAPSDAYRGEAVLTARAGDVVLLGCALAEARERLWHRLIGALLLFATAAALVLSLAVPRA